MGSARKGWTDERVNHLIGDLLRTGVVIAAVVVLVGGIAYMTGYHSASLAKRNFAGEPMELRGVAAIVKGAFSFHSLELIQFGLLILIATPIARVSLSVLVFALQRDRTYVVVTLIVLSLLLFSLVGTRY